MRGVSIILPTYREDDIASSLDALIKHLAGITGTTFELLLVDDSPASFKELIRAYAKTNEARPGPRVDVRLIDGAHKGKGDAVRLGALASRGDIVFTMDADLPVPLHHIEEFLGVFDRSGCDVVIAERPFERNLSSPLRFVLSRCLFVMQRALVFQSSQFLDTQCGFKAYRGEVIRSIAARQVVEGGMYDIEYLYVAVLDGRKVEQVRVVPNRETRASKINAWRCIYTDPRDLIHVKARGVLGGYAGRRGI